MMTFSVEHFYSVLRVNLQQEIGENRSVSLCILMANVAQLNEWEF